MHIQFQYHNAIEQCQQYILRAFASPRWRGDGRPVTRSWRGGCLYQTVYEGRPDMAHVA